MKTRMIAVTDLVQGMIIGEPVLSASGKVLLGKDIVVSSRAISLLSMWDVKFVYIVDNDNDELSGPETSQTPQSPEDTANQSKVFLKFYQEYDGIISNASQSFDFVRNYKTVPIQEMKDTSFSIYSTVLSTGPAIMDYLLVSDYNLADRVSRHSVMVAFISSVIGQQLRLSEDNIKILVLAGLLHDIGKFVIAKNDITDPLAHVIHGGKLLRNVEGLPQEVMISVLQHHECMDGSGFPMAKQGDKIHPFARIIALADIFHKEAYEGECANPFPVLERIARDKCTKLDPAVCQPFLNKIRDSLVNSSVLLSDGRTAKVIFFNGEQFEKPVVKTTADTIIDLSAQRSLSIQRIISQESLATVS